MIPLAIITALSDRKRPQPLRPEAAGYALITGASYGIGADIARCLAQHRFNLILVARSGDKLKSLVPELEGLSSTPIDVRTIVFDMGTQTAAEELHAAVADELGPDKHVDILVNNAGVAATGYFHEMSVDKLKGQTNLNVMTVLMLTRLYVNEMVHRGRGRVLQIASVVSFAPGPWAAAYHASKHYVRAMSEALQYELAETDVSVTTLCPGATATEFFTAAGAEDSWIRTKLSCLLVDKSMPVAKMGVDGMLAGTTTVIPGLWNKYLVSLIKFFSRPLSNWYIFNNWAN